MSYLIAPSILTANFLDLRKEVEMVNESEADWIHLDIMDGVFVPNLTFGFHIIGQIKTIARKPLDAHLMITDPDRYLEEFRNAGVNKLTVHYEACTHLHRTIRQIKSLGMDAGVAINPHTPIYLLETILTELDLVLNMTVNPGFGAQSFIEFSYHKIRVLKKLISETGSKALIQIDGGVDMTNIRQLADAGVDVFVVGNTVFSADDPAGVISKLKQGGK
ncbi:MAG: ribulose phosphate epimerase [Bacteroides sp. SM23_62_1]|nr:MAG: ribulose phosphate epimerase [Bacteroides sp. SM23_62_1]